MPALMLYNDIAIAYFTNYKRYPIGKAHAMGRMALPYSLELLGDWLSLGGTALGTPPPCACRATWVGPQMFSRAHGLHACLLLAGCWLQYWRLRDFCR